MDLTLPKGWDLNAALELIRILQPKVREFNYHICLGGGVLNKGFSDKDLDLYFMLMESKGAPEREKLLDYLKSMWGEPTELGGKKIEPEPPPTAIRTQINGRWYVLDSGLWNSDTNTMGAWAPWFPTEAEYPDDPQCVFEAKLKYMRGEDRIDCFIC